MAHNKRFIKCIDDPNALKIDETWWNIIHIKFNIKMSSIGSNILRIAEILRWIYISSVQFLQIRLRSRAIERLMYDDLLGLIRSDLFVDILHLIFFWAVDKNCCNQFFRINRRSLYQRWKWEGREFLKYDYYFIGSLIGISASGTDIPMSMIVVPQSLRSSLLGPISHILVGVAAPRS